MILVKICWLHGSNHEKLFIIFHSAENGCHCKIWENIQLEREKTIFCCSNSLKKKKTFRIYNVFIWTIENIFIINVMQLHPYTLDSKHAYKYK